MKKSLVYITFAVLLGVALMFAPFLASPVQIEMNTQKEPLPTFSPRNLTPENMQAMSAGSESSAGVTPHYPMDAVSAGLMLTFSLIFAFIVSSQLKKRVA